MAYTSREIERVARMGFEVARKRRKHLTSVDKNNVLVVSQLWREVVTSVAKDYPDVTLDHILVDNCSMALVHKPTQFDTIVTENTFGDILSDEAAILAGSMGMLPSASLGGTVGLYEPVHGTAPALAGEGIANPLGGDVPAVPAKHGKGRRPDRPGGAARARRGPPHGRHRGRGEAEGNPRDGKPDRERSGAPILMASGLTVAVVGATGAAGQTTLKILEERKFPVRELRAFASERSVGKTVTFRGEPVTIQRIESAAFKGV